jgi:hypothetical protein
MAKHMSQKGKSNWTIAASVVGLAGSLPLIGLYVWAAFAPNRWHWGFIVLWAFWAFYGFPSSLSESRSLAHRASSSAFARVSQHVHVSAYRPSSGGCPPVGRGACAPSQGRPAQTQTLSDLPIIVCSRRMKRSADAASLIASQNVLDD